MPRMSSRFSPSSRTSEANSRTLIAKPHAAMISSSSAWSTIDRGVAAELYQKEMQLPEEMMGVREAAKTNCACTLCEIILSGLKDVDVMHVINPRKQSRAVCTKLAVRTTISAIHLAY